MVSGAAAALTKLGFRRDVKLFLGTLIAFMVTLLLVVAVTLVTSVRRSRELIFKSWSSTANEIADDLASSNYENVDLLQRDLLLIRDRRGIAAISLRQAGGISATAGAFEGAVEKIERRRGRVTVTVGFDAAETDALQRRATGVALVGVFSAVMSTLLLFLYLPRIVQPIEEMLDEARALREQRSHEGEAEFLIETFRESVATLKAQEKQLIQLHEAEKRRADELERLTTTLTRSLSSGFLALDRDGHLLEVNAAGRTALGLPEDLDVSERDLDVLGLPELVAILRDAFDARRSIARAEVRLDDTRVIDLTTVPLITEDDVFLGMLVLFTELTEVKKLEQGLRDAHTLAELGQMSAGIAHEFRNSLSTVLGYLKLALRTELSADVRKKLLSAEEEASALARAVDGLLAFARPVKLERQPFGVAALVLSVVNRISAAAPEIRFDMRGDEFAALGDPSLLARALENVVRNSIDAVHAREGAGRIVIETSAADRRISVADDGIGLDPADAPRLFLPFQSDKQSGYGLGLALAKKIVILHGGDIALTGEPGSGARVDITLPPA